MTRRVVVLGSTGSIGTRALEVISALGYEVAAIAAGRPSPALLDQAQRHPDAVVVAAGGTREERSDFERSLGREVGFGNESVVDAAEMGDVIVINGIVGAIGLKATLAALESDNRVALANKESLVAGGPVVSRLLAAGKGELIPVDSEHSALYQ
ncbi:MAG: 1-deoxy-D-xylulose-5-phosphate reductoisomerase, partial [Acidimicrobiia bacterium]|nr:1-deoxy-D-xylulose-5-phosphate reductoisomerase [Acidimicrobiia bacterium]